MRTLKVIPLILFCVIVESCSTVPITGRRQFTLLPESQLIGMSLTAYDGFLRESRVVPDSDPRTQMIKRLGSRMSVAVAEYLSEIGQENLIRNFSWQFNLVDDPTVNAWCMPGGKIVFYTGILPIGETEDGLAVIMGHEIAHAVARHGNERMSQQMAMQFGAISLSALLSERPAEAQNLFLLAYGVGSTLGSLAFSRNHETEADRLGLIFSSMAGYDPYEAPKFWQRMSNASGGGAPPEFLSTHPNHDTRISNLNKFIPEALKYYKPRNS
ncbi:MAG: M48 family metallopeptidase [Luteibaculaceae bacterium]